MTDRAITDRTFERIETLFDIAAFANVNAHRGLRLRRRQRRAPARHVRHPQVHANRQRHPRTGEHHPACLRPTLHRPEEDRRRRRRAARPQPDRQHRNDRRGHHELSQPRRRDREGRRGGARHGQRADPLHHQRDVRSPPSSVRGRTRVHPRHRRRSWRTYRQSRSSFSRASASMPIPACSEKPAYSATSLRPSVSSRCAERLRNVNTFCPVRGPTATR